MLSLHKHHVITQLCWCYPLIVLMLSPSSPSLFIVLSSLHCTDIDPQQASCYPFTMLMLSLHSTEQPLLYWCYLPNALMLSPDIVDVIQPLHSYCAELPPLYWCFPSTNIMLSLHCTGIILSLHCTEKPAMYCTASTLLHIYHPRWSALNVEVW